MPGDKNTKRKTKFAAGPSGGRGFKTKGGGRSRGFSRQVGGRGGGGGVKVDQKQPRRVLVGHGGGGHMPSLAAGQHDKQLTPTPGPNPVGQT
jgi:hypothetical protein